MQRVILTDAQGAADFPLLIHIDDIITQKAEVNIPWESFTFEK